MDQTIRELDVSIIRVRVNDDSLESPAVASVLRRLTADSFGWKT